MIILTEKMCIRDRYPPTNLSTVKYKDAEECAASMESLLLGYNIMRNIKEAYNSHVKICMGNCQ